MSQGMLGNVSLSSIQGPRYDLEQKLASDDGDKWLTALKRFLRKENPWKSEAPLHSALHFRINLEWVETKPGETIEHLLELLKMNACRVPDCAADIIRSSALSLSVKQGMLDVIALSVRALGFKARPYYCEIVERARERALCCCPAAVGPVLRAQFTAQPADLLINIAMKPIRLAQGQPLIFYLANGATPRDLGVRCVEWYQTFDPSEFFAFVPCA